MQDNQNLSKRNARVGLIVLAAVVAMLSLSYASVPLYNLFCRVTGYGGTTQVAQSLPDQVIDRTVTIRFDTNTARNLPWTFRPEVHEVSLKLGEKGFTNFIAFNKAKTPMAGTALFNVTPLKVGKYFTKIQCFCFDEQILQPQERMNMPVLFYVDPKMHEDPDMQDVSVITLSYSFFKTDSPELDKALEAFYNSGQSQKPEQGF